MTTYDQGDVVRCTATFTDTNGTAVDPTALTFTYRDKGGTSTTYTYLSDAQLVKTSTGVYYVDISIPTGGSYAGPWVYRFAGTGTNAAAAEGTFTVASTLIYP